MLISVGAFAQGHLVDLRARLNFFVFVSPSVLGVWWKTAMATVIPSSTVGAGTPPPQVVRQQTTAGRCFAVAGLFAGDPLVALPSLARPPFVFLGI